MMAMNTLTTQCAFTLIVGCVLLCVDFSSCVTMLSVEVPDHLIVGSLTRLLCQFDLEKERLYSVKWYKDGNEFYRYLPGDEPPAQAFHVNSVSVDTNRSSDQQVVLNNLTLGTSGYYTCEVSAERPRFATATGHIEIEVIDLPDSRPVLVGAKSSGYEVGEVVDVNCTSPNSMPPATLKWYINNEPVNPDYLTKSPPSKNSSSGMYTSSLGLTFPLRSADFSNGYVSIKCTATIYSKYYQSSELYLSRLESKETDEQETSGQDSILVRSTGQSSLLLLPLSMFIALQWRPLISSF